MPIQILSNNKMEPFEHNLHIDSEELTSRNIDIDCMCQSYIDKLEPRFFCGIFVHHLFIFLCVFLVFVFVLCIVYPMFPVSLDCPLLIVHSVLSNVYLIL
jgi:hypothetical protein